MLIVVLPAPALMEKLLRVLANIFALLGFVGVLRRIVLKPAKYEQFTTYGIVKRVKLREQI